MSHGGKRYNWKWGEPLPIVKDIGNVFKKAENYGKWILVGIGLIAVIKVADVVGDLAD